MNNFYERWLEAVDRKNSVLCAGLDPADPGMGRPKDSLPKGVDIRTWSLDYVKAVAPFCAAIKPNINYWKGMGGMDALYEIAALARSLEMVVIDDSKLADISSTNDAGMYYSAQKGNMAVTVAPFGGNLEEMANQGRARDLGIICMCLMSNLEYEKEKNKLVQVLTTGYDDADIIMVNGVPRVEQYQQLAHDARLFGISGIVIGAPSETNHITEEELRKACNYAGEEMLVLLPGVGKQGGEAGSIWRYMGRNNVIVNVGRDLMFPNGPTSTQENQAERARYYQEMFNRLR